MEAMCQCLLALVHLAPAVMLLCQPAQVSQATLAPFAFRHPSLPCHLGQPTFQRAAVHHQVDKSASKPALHLNRSQATFVFQLVLVPAAAPPWSALVTPRVRVQLVGQHF